MIFDGKKILVTGGTGSLGNVFVKRLLSGKMGTPAKILVFSRDEAKQHEMRLNYLQRRVSTEDIIYHNFQRTLQFCIGDLRDYSSVVGALQDIDIVINAGALKQVPSCEYFPMEAVRTNVLGAENIVRAVREHRFPVETVVSISTDKACKPVNVMGLTKGLQEKIFIAGNMFAPQTRFVCVRYGNVLASRGSVVPLFLDQIETGGPLTVTTPEMTRFFLSLNDAVDIVVEAIRSAHPGEVYIPKAPSAYLKNIAQALIGKKKLKINYVGVRPGEKVHEILVSEEEAPRTFNRGKYFAIRPMLPELNSGPVEGELINKEYSSSDSPLSLPETVALLKKHRLITGSPVTLQRQPELFV